VKRFLPSSLFNRDALTTSMEIAGAGCVVAGAFIIFGLGVGMCVLGLALIALGYLGGAE